MGLAMRNPYYDLSVDIGFSWLAAREAIRADMEATPGKEDYTIPDLAAVLITAGIISDISELAGLGWLTDDLSAWLAQFEEYTEYAIPTRNA